MISSRSSIAGVSRCSSLIKAAPAPAPTPRRVARATAAAAAASADNGQFAFAEGARVRVKDEVKVYHVPKHAEVSLQGREGVVKKIAALHKGALLSATLQYRVQFEAADLGAKFFAHLAEEELESA